MRPLVGFRFARVCMADREECVTGNLSSPVATRYIWGPGTNIASCDPGGSSERESGHTHSAPAPGCYCGLYGWHSLETLLRIVRPAPLGRFDFRYHWRVPHRLDRVVVVAVTGWGNVLIHERGWRAQFARIVAISDELPVVDMKSPYFRAEPRAPARVITPELAQTIAARYRLAVVSLKQLAKVATIAGVTTQPVPKSELLEAGDVDLGPELPAGACRAVVLG